MLTEWTNDKPMKNSALAASLLCQCHDELGIEFLHFFLAELRDRDERVFDDLYRALFEQTGLTV